MVIYAGTQGAIMIDIAAIKARADKAPKGPWKDIPWHITEGAPEVRVAEGWLLCAVSSDTHAAFIAHARTDIPALLTALETSETARVKAEQALWELDAVGCDFGYYEQAAKTMKSIVDKAIDGLLKQPSILTSTEQKAQGKRCSCGGADDYCVCQNSPDKNTISKRITALEQERDALKKALTAVRDDLQVRAVKNVVAVGVSVWIEVNTALEAKP